MVDDKFYTFAYIPSYGYSQRACVPAGCSIHQRRAKAWDVDIFLTKIPKENIYNKNRYAGETPTRVPASESHDTDSDYHASGWTRFYPANI